MAFLLGLGDESTSGTPAPVAGGLLLAMGVGTMAGLFFAVVAAKRLIRSRSARSVGSGRPEKHQP